MKEEGFYQIINLRSGKILVNKAKKASSVFEKMRGLLGRERLSENEALIISTNGSIHTFFMKFAIDLLFLDQEGRVLKIAERIKPFKIIFAPFKNKNVIELAEGAIEKLNIKL